MVSPAVPRLRFPALVEIGGVDLLILDPVVAAIPASRNSHNNAETRAGLQPVVDFAKTASCAVVGIAHLTKFTSGKDPVERVTGSLAFGAVPRGVMGCPKSKDEGSHSRIFVRIDSNNGPSDGGFGYDIEVELGDTTRIAWGDVIEGTAKELFDEAESEPVDPENLSHKRKDAVAWLQAQLAKGMRASLEIDAEAKASKISIATLRRAKKDAMIKSVQIPKGSGPWFCHLPEPKRG